MPFKRTLAPALLALAVCSAPLAASAQNFSDAQRGEIETIIKNYLVTHPEVLEEASAELSKRQQAAEAEKHANAVAENAKTLFNCRAASPSATRTATSISSSSSITTAAIASTPWAICFRC